MGLAGRKIGARGGKKPTHKKRKCQFSRLRNQWLALKSFGIDRKVLEDYDNQTNEGGQSEGMVFFRTFGRHSPTLLLLGRSELSKVLLGLSFSIEVRRVDFNVFTRLVEVVEDVELLLGVFFVGASREGHAAKH